MEHFDTESFLANQIMGAFKVKEPAVYHDLAGNEIRSSQYIKRTTRISALLRHKGQVLELRHK